MPLTIQDARNFINDPAAVSLGAFDTIDDAAAEILGKQAGELELDELDLSGLTQLSGIAAEQLANYSGVLNLDGLAQLSDAAAKSLSQHCGGLSFNGVSQLSDAAAESLSRHGGVLSLNGLSQLSEAVADSLSQLKGTLILDGLAQLSDAAADSLSRLQGGLSLNGLSQLSDAAAARLGTHHIVDTTIGLPITDQDHVELRQIRDQLGIRDENLVSPEASRQICLMLNRGMGCLELMGLKVLSEAAARGS